MTDDAKCAFGWNEIIKINAKTARDLAANPTDGWKTRTLLRLLAAANNVVHLYCGISSLDRFVRTFNRQNKAKATVEGVQKLLLLM